MLNEAADHLYSDAARRTAEGASRTDAAEAAIASFGTANALARDHRRTGGRIVSTGWLFAALGLIAVGLSGLLANALGALWGWEFVAGDPSGLTYSPQRCAELLALVPGETNCNHAALVDHYAEVVDQRVLMGIGGLALLAGYLWWRRHGGVRADRLLLGAAAVVSFTLAAIVQLADALTAARFDQGMVGALLAGGLVALVFAIATTPVLVSGLRTR